MKSIAFAGLGAMGWPMASLLKSADFQVHGIDAFEQKVSAFNGQPVSAEQQNRILETCDAFFLMVVNTEQVRSLLFEKGVVNTLKEAACIVQMSTISPDDAAAIARDVAAVRPDLQYLDAPVSGGVVGAQAGELTIMVSGPKSAQQACRAAFDALSKAVYEAGQQPGQGSAMKAVNQLLCGVHIAAAAEAFALAEKSGIDTSTMLSMLEGSAASSWMLKDRGPRMIAEPGDVTSVIDIFCKDMGIVCDAAKASQAFTPLAETARQLFVSSSQRGEGKLDDSQLIRTYRLLNGAG